MSATVSDERVQIAGASVHTLKGGSGAGAPVVFLHSIEGNLGWLPWMDAIAQSAPVYAPTHPGFGESERPDWLESVSDMARFYLWMFQEMGLDRVSLVGHFLGGWIAAEMATMNPGILQSLTLVDTAGVRPRDGEIADVFLLGEEETLRRSFHDAAGVPNYAALFPADPTPEEREARIINREMTTRLCWKPYMRDRSLLPLLRRVNAPTLIVWGAEDRIIPSDAGRRIHEAIAGSRLEIIPQCGHMPHVEKAETFAGLVGDVAL